MQMKSASSIDLKVISRCDISVNVKRCEAYYRQS